MFITADQIVAHAIGDFLLQSDWMANDKAKSHIAALAHAFVYALCFIVFKPSFTALMVIFISHYLIDHYKGARVLVWLKNYLSPRDTFSSWDGNKAIFRRWWYSWDEVKDNGGYGPLVPPWLAIWLMIIADNIVHVVINAAALRWL